MMTSGASIRVAFQGDHGAYGDLAIQQRWGGAATSVSHRDFTDVVEAVESGSVHYGVIPVHNRIYGPIVRAQKALSQRSLIIDGHIELAVDHCLLGLAGVELHEVHTVMSHPVALAQCRRFMAAHRLIGSPYYDTAGAARWVAACGDRTVAAIASGSCADRYGLAVLARGVSDRVDNATRFAIVRKTPRVPSTLAASAGPPR